MKKHTTVLLILASCTAAYSQDLAGEWSGALLVQGKELKIIFHVTKNNDGYDATLDSPGQGASGIKVTTAHFSNPTVRFEISGIGAVYEGLWADKGITGKWMQPGTALFLALLKSEDPSKKDRLKNSEKYHEQTLFRHCFG